MDSNVHHNFKRFRRQIGLTQRQLADRLGISRAKIANYESRSKVPFGLAKQIEHEFGGEWKKEYFRPDWP